MSAFQAGRDDVPISARTTRSQEDIVEIASDEAVRPIMIELRDPFGQIIARWELGEQYPESGGAYTLGAFMDAYAWTSIKAPFVAPGGDARAPYYFHIKRIP